MLASPPAHDAPAATATIDTTAAVEAKSDRSMTPTRRDETTTEDEGTNDLETAVDDASVALPPPMHDIDLSLDDTTVTELEEIVDNTRAELRQWKRELRQARRDKRRQHRYERRFGPE